MRALPHTGAAVALGVAVLAAVGLVVGGNGGDEPPTPADRTAVPSVSPPVDPDQDYTDPTAVCLSFADTVHRHDTRTDTSAQAAYRRAMAYATAELAAAVAAQPEARDHQWPTWRSHQAATAPTVVAAVADGDVQPADTATNAYRVAHVSLTPVGVDGWRGPTQQRLVLCTLRRDSGGWRVERYQITDTPEPR